MTRHLPHSASSGEPSLAVLTVAYGLGAALVAYGGWLLLTTRTLPNLLPVIWWLAGGLVAHDGVLAPLAVLVGLVVARFVPAGIRAPVQAGLFATAAVVLATGSVVLGFGRRPDNPSLLPLPYGRNLLIVLGMVWVVIAVLCVVSVANRRRRAADDDSVDGKRNGESVVDPAHRGGGQRG